MGQRGALGDSAGAALRGAVKRNVVSNTAHADAAGIQANLPGPVWWDERLLG
jgi:hypothetical protein